MSFSSTVFDIDYTYDEHGNLASSKMLAYISNYDEPMFAQEWTYEYAWIEQPTELVRMYRSPLPIMLYYGRTIRRMALVATATASATSSVMVTSSGSSSDIMPSARSTPVDPVKEAAPVVRAHERHRRVRHLVRLDEGEKLEQLVQRTETTRKTMAPSEYLTNIVLRTKKYRNVMPRLTQRLSSCSCGSSMPRPIEVPPRSSAPAVGPPP